MRVTVRWMAVADAPRSLARDEAEAARLAALRSEDDRRRFLAARVLLRHAVAEVSGCPLGRVEILQSCRRCGGPHGQPKVRTGTARPPHVSVARSRDLVIVAVAPSAVGVDVERVPDPARAGELRTWVRTEAVLKATGHGLDVDPSLLAFTPPTSPPRLARWEGPGRRPRVRLADVDAPAGYVAAVASVGRRSPLVDARPLSLTPA